MKTEYIKLGKCIWCLQEKPLVSFYNKPHTISKQIGGANIGFDVCDSCNHDFGTSLNTTKYPMSIELAFKEVFNVTKHLLPDVTKKKVIQNQILKSVYFEYYKSKGLFRIKKRFEFKPDFINLFTRQFKKGVYEIFLQEYHRNTELGHDKRFDSIRDFVRKDLGDLPLYFAMNNGVYLLPENYDTPMLSFNQHTITSINDYGFYSIILFGHLLYIEVTPKALLSRDIYLRAEEKQIVKSGFIYSGIREMQYITELDFTLYKLRT